MKRIDYVSELLKLKDVSPSFLFLYPILQLNNKIKPLGTYMEIQGLDLRYSLTCVFHKNQIGFKTSWLKLMKEHDLFQGHFIDNDDFHYLLFDFLDYTPVVNKIKKGEYSKIHPDFKFIMCQNQNTLTHMGLYPDQYYSNVAYDLDVDIEVLINGVELMPPPNEDNEYLNVPESLKKMISAELLEF